MIYILIVCVFFVDCQHVLLQILYDVVFKNKPQGFDASCTPAPHDVLWGKTLHVAINSHILLWLFV